MNTQLQSPADLLDQLREAYRSLPAHMQARVASLLRASLPPQPLPIERAG
jgi:hypothetical protein